MPRRPRFMLLLAPLALALGGCAVLQRGPVGNPAVPQPARSLDVDRYLGRWFEVGRYENGFEKGCAGVTADYSRRDDGLIRVVNSCRVGGLDGRLKQSVGRARLVAPAKLKVSFFGPIWGDYWVLDRADDYSWAIVGEPSGRFLWLLARRPGAAVTQALVERAGRLGYDTRLITRTAQPAS